MYNYELTPENFEKCEFRSRKIFPDKISGEFFMRLDGLSENEKQDIINNTIMLNPNTAMIFKGCTLNYTYDTVYDDLNISLIPLFSDEKGNNIDVSIDPIEVDIYEDKVKESFLSSIGVNITKSIFKELSDSVQARREKDNKTRPAIYEIDENGHGKIKDDIIIGDIIPLLDELSDYEIHMSDEQIVQFRNDPDICNMYTYNYSGNVDVDFSIWYKEGSPIGLFCLHTGLDARLGFTDFATFAIPDYDNALEGLLNLETIDQHKEISYKYEADIHLTRDTYEVYDYQKDEYVGEYCLMEVGDLLSEIEEKEEERDV